MAIAERALLSRARRAYEAGRVLLGLRWAAAVCPMLAFSLVVCGRPAASGVAALALAMSVGCFEWRGQALGRGARAGLLAGLPPLLLPGLVTATGHLCGSRFCASFSAVCFFGGVLGGAVLGSRAAAPNRDGLALAAAGVTAVLAGSLGCIVAGVGGVAGLVLGLTLGAAPLIVRRA